MFDAAFWLMIAFFIFVGFVAKPVGRVVVKALDARTIRIRKELDEALRLKEEAQEVLAEYQRDHKDAAEEIESILKHAREEAERITKKATETLEKEIARRTELAEQKIAQAEAAVIKQLRDNAVDITTSAARVLIMENLNREVAEEIVSKAISDIGRKLH